jgi:hypothetical protein
MLLLAIELCEGGEHARDSYMYAKEIRQFYLQVSR